MLTRGRRECIYGLDNSVICFYTCADCLLKKFRDNRFAETRYGSRGIGIGCSGKHLLVTLSYYWDQKKVLLYYYYSLSLSLSLSPSLSLPLPLSPSLSTQGTRRRLFITHDREGFIRSQPMKLYAHARTWKSNICLNKSHEWNFFEPITISLEDTQWLRPHFTTRLMIRFDHDDVTWFWWSLTWPKS